MEGYIMFMNSVNLEFGDVAGKCTCRWLRTLALAVLVGANWANSAHAEFPDRPIQLVSPNPAGGGSDITWRKIMDQVQRIFKQPVIIVNKPGASGFEAVRTVARAKPDGYTILLSTQGAMAANPAIYSDLPYDPIKDFVSIGNFLSSGPVVVVSSQLPINSIAELIAYAKAHPGLNFGSIGVGSFPHLAAVNLARRTNIDIVHIPYRTSGELARDLSTGTVSLVIQNYSNVRLLVESGKVRVLATTGARRLTALPDVRTMVEAGVPGYILEGWQALFAPANTPKDVLHTLFDAIVPVINQPETRKYLELDLGLSIDIKSSEEMTDFLPREMARLKTIVEAAGAKVR